MLPCGKGLKNYQRNIRIATKYLLNSSSYKWVTIGISQIWKLLNVMLNASQVHNHAIVLCRICYFSTLPSSFSLPGQDHQGRPVSLQQCKSILVSVAYSVFADCMPLSSVLLTHPCSNVPTYGLKHYRLPPACWMTVRCRLSW